MTAMKRIGQLMGGLIALTLMGGSACSGEREALVLPDSSYQLDEPAHFQRLVLPEGIALTEAGIALGRRLFFDPILSADSSLSCATCHLPQQAFADAQPIARGIQQRIGQRNSPSLANVAYYYKGLFWDGRAATLEEQALLPVEDPNELGHDWGQVEKALRRHPHYPAHFAEAFGIQDTAQINRELAARALAQFQRTLISADAKYDRVMQGKASFTPAELRGKHIFFDSSEELPHGECGHCHTPPLFTDLTFMNNGLDEAASLADFKDKGRGAAIDQYYDNGRFRVPSLRNVALTAPYMHDGRFHDLEAVIEHYNRGGHLSENVDPKIRRLELSARDKQDLLAFLHTLTDTAFTQNQKFSNPFLY
jgi:cytochrome c peroxidase